MITTVWILLLVLQVSLVVFAAFYLYADIRLGVAAVPSSSQAVRAVVALLSRFSGRQVVDLGSGWGGMAIAAARACPEKEVTGLELAVLPYAYARLRQRFFNRDLGNLRFLRQDLFAYDLSGTEIVFCYMPPEIMPRIKAKLAELPKGAIVISNSATFDGLTPIETHEIKGLLPEQIFVYRMT